MFIYLISSYTKLIEYLNLRPRGKVDLGAYLFEIVGIGLAISVMAFVGGDIYKKELCEVIYEECKIEENNIIILEKLKRGR